MRKIKNEENVKDGKLQSREGILTKTKINSFVKNKPSLGKVSFTNSGTRSRENSNIKQKKTEKRLVKSEIKKRKKKRRLKKRNNPVNGGTQTGGSGPNLKFNSDDQKIGATTCSKY